MIWDSLMDTGATRSCMNYNTFMKLGTKNLRQKEGQGPLCRAVQFLGLYFSLFLFCFYVFVF